jgi:hypothetical protein
MTPDRIRRPIMATQIPIAELADVLDGRSNAYKAVAMLKAYSDDSGTCAGSSITAIGSSGISNLSRESTEHNRNSKGHMVPMKCELAKPIEADSEPLDRGDFR